MVTQTVKHRRYAARACKRKKRYRDKQEALQVARRRQQQGGYRLRVYECSECRGHHITKALREE